MKKYKVQGSGTKAPADLSLQAGLVTGDWSLSSTNPSRICYFRSKTAVRTTSPSGVRERDLSVPSVAPVQPAKRQPGAGLGGEGQGHAGDPDPGQALRRQLQVVAVQPETSSGRVGDLQGQTAGGGVQLQIPDQQLRRRGRTGLQEAVRYPRRPLIAS